MKSFFIFDEPLLDFLLERGEPGFAGSDSLSQKVAETDQKGGLLPAMPFFQEQVDQGFQGFRGDGFQSVESFPQKEEDRVFHFFQKIFQGKFERQEVLRLPQRGE